MPCDPQKAFRWHVHLKWIPKHCVVCKGVGGYGHMGAQREGREGKGIEMGTERNKVQ